MLLTIPSERSLVTISHWVYNFFFGTLQKQVRKPLTMKTSYKTEQFAFPNAEDLLCHERLKDTHDEILFAAYLAPIQGDQIGQTFWSYDGDLHCKEMLGSVTATSYGYRFQFSRQYVLSIMISYTFADKTAEITFRDKHCSDTISHPAIVNINSSCIKISILHNN